MSKKCGFGIAIGRDKNIEIILINKYYLLLKNTSKRGILYSDGGNVPLYPVLKA